MIRARRIGGMSDQAGNAALAEATAVYLAGSIERDAALRSRYDIRVIGEEPADAR